VDAYAPIVSESSESVQEAYSAVQELLEDGNGFVADAQELIVDAASVHTAAVEVSTDPLTGDRDLITYILTLLAGGGGLLAERKRTKSERDRMHQRVDGEKEKREELGAALAELKSRSDCPSISFDKEAAQAILEDLDNILTILSPLIPLLL